MHKTNRQICCNFHHTIILQMCLKTVPRYFPYPLAVLEQHYERSCQQAYSMRKHKFERQTYVQMRVASNTDLLARLIRYSLRAITSFLKHNHNTLQFLRTSQKSAPNKKEILLRVNQVTLIFTFCLRRVKLERTGLRVQRGCFFVLSIFSLKSVTAFQDTLNCPNHQFISRKTCSTQGKANSSNT